VTLSLGEILTDHMVLQRDVAAPIWGKATPETAVRVRVAGVTYHGHTDSAGAWRVDVGPLPAGGPFTLEVHAGDGELQLADVFFGDVWLLAGQSNMGMGLRAANGGAAEAEAGASATPLRLSNYPESAWRLNTPEAAMAFSAVGYSFGHRLQRRLDVPVGLLDRSLGGTAIQAWYREQAADEELRKHIFDPWHHYLATYPERAAANAELPEAEQLELVPPDHHGTRPANLYKQRIATLLPLAVRGVVWYQGESDAWGLAMARWYEKQLRALVSDWRAAFATDRLPFVLVQLPNPAPKPDAVQLGPAPWQVVQETQARVAEDDPDIGLAVTVDDGENDIHPKNKLPVGQRAAAAALDVAYGHGVGQGPVCYGLRLDGDEVRVYLRRTAGGLLLRDDLPRGFALAGADRRFFPATARVQGDTIVLRSPEVPHPVAARYAYAFGSDWSLMNAAGHLAGPFRTDNWPMDDAPGTPRTLRAVAAAEASGASPEVTPFTIWQTRARPSAGTGLSASYDAQGVHLRLAARDLPEAEPEGDDPWSATALDVAIDPWRDGQHYCRFLVGRNGKTWTARQTNRSCVYRDIIEHVKGGACRVTDEAWEPDFRFHNHEEGSEWVLTLDIPWATLGIPEPVPGMAMGLQVLRYDPARGETSEWTRTGCDLVTGAMPMLRDTGRADYLAPSRFGALLLLPEV